MSGELREDRTPPPDLGRRDPRPDGDDSSWIAGIPPCRFAEPPCLLPGQIVLQHHVTT